MNSKASVYRLKGIVILFVFLFVPLLAFVCDGDKQGGDKTEPPKKEEEPKKFVTPANDIAPNVSPPARYPFPKGSEPPQNSFPYGTLPASCSTKVKDPPGITVNLSGTVKGKLKFNLRQRGYPAGKNCNGGNTDLGGDYQNNGMAPDFYNFKFQVEITWEGPMADAIYGQMITDILSPDAKEVSFINDCPANDYEGKQWNLKPSEKREDYPVVELDGQTIRWIDAPGGSAIRVKNMKYYVIIYAGACKKITHIKIFRIDYPGGNTPTMKELSQEDFKKEVTKFTFVPDK